MQKRPAWPALEVSRAWLQKACSPVPGPLGFLRGRDMMQRKKCAQERTRSAAVRAAVLWPSFAEPRVRPRRRGARRRTRRRGPLDAWLIYASQLPSHASNFLIVFFCTPFRDFYGGSRAHVFAGSRLFGTFTTQPIHGQHCGRGLWFVSTAACQALRADSGVVVLPMAAIPAVEACPGLGPWPECTGHSARALACYGTN